MRPSRRPLRAFAPPAAVLSFPASSGSSSTERMALLVFATLMICAPLALAGETISLAPGSAGCVAEPPGAPTALKAIPKDGRLILGWSPPADGSCVQTYVVNVLDPTMRSGIPVQTTSTDADNTTVLGLENNKTYRIQVQAGREEEARTWMLQSACLPPLHTLLRKHESRFNSSLQA